MCVPPFLLLKKKNHKKPLNETWEVFSKKKIGNNVFNSFAKVHKNLILFVNYVLM